MGMRSAVRDLGIWFGAKMLRLSFSTMFRNFLAGVSGSTNVETAAQVQACNDKILGILAREQSEDRASDKVRCLLALLRRLEGDESESVQAIIFVQRRAHCRILYEYVLEHIPSLRAGCLLGQSASTDDAAQGLTNAKRSLEDFSDGVTRILFSTAVSSEGLDISGCGMVIVFDEIASPRQLIHICGRARRSNGKVLYLVPQFDEEFRGRLGQVLESVKCIKMGNLSFENSVPPSKGPRSQKGLRVYLLRSPETNAYVDLDNSVQLLNEFCQKSAGNDEYKLDPVFAIESRAQPETKGAAAHAASFRAELRLPACFDVPRLFSDWMPSKPDARACVAFEAMREFFKRGWLDKNFVATLTREHVRDTLIEKLGITAPDQKKGPYFARRLDAAALGLLPIMPFNAADEAFVYRLSGFSFALVTKTKLPDDFKSAATVNIDAEEKQIAAELLFTVRFSEAQWLLLLEGYLKLMRVHVFGLKQAEIFNASNSAEYGDDKGYCLAPLRFSDGTPGICWDTIRLFCGDTVLETVDEHPIEHFISAPYDHLQRVFLIEKLADTTLVTYFEETERLKKVREESGGHVKKKVKLPAGTPKQTVLARWYTDEHFSVAEKTRPLISGFQLPSSAQLMKARLSGMTQMRETFKKPRFLIPEITRKVPLPASPFVEGLELLPFCFMMECGLLNSKMYEKLQALVGYTLPLEMVARAMTKPEYETLELIGDSFLKLEVTWYLHHEHEEVRLEGILSVLRSALVNNDYLRDLSEKADLDAYIIHPLIVPQDFQTVWCPSLVWPTENIKFSRKIVADVIEATLGAYLTVAGEHTARKFLRSIGLPVLSDHKMYKQRYYLQDDSLTAADNVNLENETEPADSKLPLLQQQLGYSFNNTLLLLEAISHPSNFHHLVNPADVSGFDYQRLEFLGDAVIEYVVICDASRKHPDWSPGQLTAWKKRTLTNLNFSRVAATRFKLHHFILQSIPQFQCDIYAPAETCDPDWMPPKLLADAFEALVGAVFMDSDHDLHTVERVFLRHVLETADEFPEAEEEPTARAKDALDEEAEEPAESGPAGGATKPSQSERGGDDGEMRPTSGGAEAGTSRKVGADTMESETVQALGSGMKKMEKRKAAVDAGHDSDRSKCDGV